MISESFKCTISFYKVVCKNYMSNNLYKVDSVYVTLMLILFYFNILMSKIIINVLKNVMLLYIE